MAGNRKTAYGAPPEAKEVVVTVDRRLVYALGLVLAFVVAVGGGVLAARRGAATQAPGAPSAPAAKAPGAPAVDPAAAMQQAIAQGLPTSVTIINTNVEALSTPVPGALDPNDPYAEAKAKITPADDVHDALLSNPGSVPIEIPEDRKVDASKWPHDVLAKFPDPNVAAEDYKPMRSEVAPSGLEGPRLAISELNEQFTYDFGVVPMDRVAKHDFEAKNVGNADLVISRVYTGCGCTATRIGEVLIDASGFLPQLITLAPGESVRFTVEFDPRAEGKSGAQAKYIQIFSNDPTRAIYDAAEANSHETRFRIVVEPR